MHPPSSRSYPQYLPSYHLSSFLLLLYLFFIVSWLSLSLSVSSCLFALPPLAYFSLFSGNLSDLPSLSPPSFAVNLSTFVYPLWLSVHSLFLSSLLPLLFFSPLLCCCFFFMCVCLLEFIYPFSLLLPSFFSFSPFILFIISRLFS